MKGDISPDKISRTEVVFDERFQGPFSMIHGGYVSGFMAMRINNDTVEVTMRNPTPAKKSLTVESETPDRIFLYDEDLLLIEARASELNVEMPVPITIDVATQSSLRHVTEWSLPNCFGCGTDRSEDGGLHLRAGPVEGRNMVAVDWVPCTANIGVDVDREVPKPFAWAAIECTAIQAMNYSGLMKPEEMVILGRMTTKIQSLPKVGHSCFITGWPVGREGRKITVAGSIHDETGGLLLVSQLVFILLQ